MRLDRLIVACGALIGWSIIGAGAQARLPEIARALTILNGYQGRVMWVDATANIDRITNIDGIRDIVQRCNRAHITTLVVDVKPVVGQVMFKSTIAAPLRTWQQKPVPDIDVLQAFVEECGKAGIEVAASFNVLSEGHKYYNAGLAYQKPEWQSVAYVPDRQMRGPDGVPLGVRGAGEPEDAAKPLVQGSDFLLLAGGAAGSRLAIALDDDRRVAGMLDPALMGDEPLQAPEDGRMLVLDGPNMDWAGQHLRAGDQVRFAVSGKRVPVAAAASEKVAAFVNPLNLEARRHEMSLMKEVVEKYPVSAIVFDRLRFANLYNDYSDVSRQSFEQWIGSSIAQWPEDVIRFDPVPGEPMVQGRYYKRWLEFRARVIREFVNEATETMRTARKSIRFGAYVGSWYSSYFGVGVNWGSECLPVRTDWATDTYNRTGYAEYLDWLSTGCYYDYPTRADARMAHRESGGSVEAAAELSSRVVMGATPVYAGLYVLRFKDRPQDFLRAIQIATQRSQGVMIFDISQVYDYNWWPVLEEAFARTALPPHLDPALTAQLRSAYDAVRRLDDSGNSSDRLPVIPGQSGGG